MARQLDGKKNVERKGAEPDFLLTEWLDNWKGSRRCRSEGNSASLLVNRMARQLEVKQSRRSEGNRARLLFKRMARKLEGKTEFLK
jgi:hypothetical protein